MDDKLFTKLAAVPILALFLGVAILGARIALDWTEELSQIVIGGLLTICAGSVALIAIIIGLVVGIGLYKSLNRDRQQEQPPLPAIRTLGGYPVMPYREPSHPQLTDGRDKLGSWSSNGLSSYDVWSDPEEWQEPARLER
jgi:hypothetical protein